ncbi:MULTISPECIES: DUF6694 family lipoprotein [Pseudomonas]|uniref:Lipoprotein n=1 Tax=Pseudomonas simiae TaxID=321846 RepID=A0ABS9G6K9_9PSED|nr:MULTISPECIES: DUF6694 family lipoprotein [Pseudomonas]MCF5170669.1 hypothetical protein [Pseudomonas canadensis]MCF5188333.1 hypothetical protein [Pseudomonas simiae]MCF5288695.1 hypothetical protein [Pseudomonas simiae]MCF5320677.1 hypothetical protein [Pseudomonas simiae]MCF5337736.1 hypothetical protein [Pseudomonas simiae]
MRRFICIALMAGMLAGCGEPTLDGSSQKAFKDSAAKVAASLPEDKRKQFASDVMVLAFQGLDISQVLQGKKNAEGVSADMLAALNGKTAQQVADEANRVRTERAERERQQALTEIQELLEKQKKSEAAKTELARFKVSKSRFYQRAKEYGLGNQPIIEITVNNGTASAVSRAYFKGTIASPGRSVPWLVETFNYSISGGLEPGESQSWSLAPNQFSDWGKVEPQKDAIFTVTVERLDGADDKPLFDAGSFTERDATRLTALQTKYAQ